MRPISASSVLVAIRLPSFIGWFLLFRAPGTAMEIAPVPLAFAVNVRLNTVPSPEMPCDPGVRAARRPDSATRAPVPETGRHDPYRCSVRVAG